MKEIFCFDLDETLCNTINKDYGNSTPILKMIEKVNHLYSNGNIIKIYTARGMGKFEGDVSKVYNAYYNLTKNLIDSWGLKYHELILGKPSFDYFIDDKNMTIEEFKKAINPKIGFIAGAFDIIHPGYIKMLIDCKKECDYLIVGLHECPEKNNKLKPVLDISDRFNILSSIKYIDEIHKYKTEEDLLNFLKNTNIDVRFLGDDYIGKDFTGSDLEIQIHYLDRSHKWSTTKLKEQIRNQIK
jgi:glycerol-3-phosphate cytidylyltransferase